jgi:indolepyruvate ferredoxin oxidoreductase, alpha subunit
MQTKKSININNQRILMGNEALGRGIVEAGVSLAASYPGTPTSGNISPLF